MNIINRLTLRHLRLNRGRTAITLLGIALSVAMVCCVAGFAMSMRDLLVREVKDRGDYHVVYADVAPEVADAVIGEDVFLAGSAYMDDGGVGGLPELFLRLKSPGRDIREVVDAVAVRHGIGSWSLNNELLALEGVMPMDNVLFTFVVIAGIAVAIIMIGSVMVIANAFNISSTERARQFGMLKSVGATGGQLARSVLFEAAALTAVAIPVGVLLGFLIQVAVLRLTNTLLDEIASQFTVDTTFHVMLSPAVAAFAAAVAVITSTLSAWGPARRAAATSPIDAIRQAKDISIRSGETRGAARIATRLFGIEGALAAKTIRRNRGKYRAAVISLTLSIVLFVSMSAFVHTINRVVEMEYGGYDFDVAVSVTGRLESIDAADAALRAIPDASVKRSLNIGLGTAVPDGFFTPVAQEMGPFDDEVGIAAHSMPDDEIAEYVSQAEGAIVGVLVNNAVFARDGKKMEAAPFNCEIGTTLPMLYGGDDGETPAEIGRVTIGSVVTEVSEDFPSALFNSSRINIYIPESAYRGLFSGYEENSAAFAATTADPDAFSDKAIEILESATFDGGFGYGINNIAQMTRLYRNISLIVMLFGYGFIAMLSLISVTSVVTTISTGMALRRQEFAMLHSVGMTPEGMNKMLNLEGIMYGLKSMLIGLPIGAALSYLIHWGMMGVFEFSYEPPLGAMAVGSAAIVALTFFTMRYSKRKLGRISIVEAIRRETA